MNQKVLAVMLLFVLLSPAIQFASVSAQGVPYPDTLITETIGEPMYADPGFQYDSASLELLYNVYEQLIFFDFTSASTFEGIIADSWWGELCDVTDPITGLNYQQKWAFHIRSGVHFHDVPESDWAGEGLEVTPEDVEYSFERNMVVDASTSGELLIYDALLHVYYANMSDELWGRKIDFAVQRNDTERTVTFYLLTPFEPFLQIIAQPFGAIMSKAWMLDTRIQEHEKNWPGTWPDWTQPNSPENNYTAWHEYHDPPTSPIEMVDCSSPGPHLDYMLGTGPYMFKYWNKGSGGDYYCMKNPNYWRGWSGKHVENFQSKYIASWDTRRDHFLAGQADTVLVPLTFISQVQGQPGIRGMKDLPMLYCLGMFMCGNISATSPYIGTIPPDGEFNGIGFPTNGFQDEKLRKAFRALFPFDTFLNDVYMGEAIQPATCVVPGLAYYDPSIPKPQYNRTLAIKLLKEAWGGSEESPGPVWTNGFTMSFVFPASSNPGQLFWAEMLKEEFDYINANYGTHFNVTVTMVQPGIYYVTLWKTKQLPLFPLAWGADYPDAHNFVVPFMDSVDGAFAKLQDFPNDTINQWIRNGINTIFASERQYWYTKLQQAYIDNCYSFALSTPTYRRWERDWVQGWYYHPATCGQEYAYYRWKQDSAEVTHDIALTATPPKVCNLGDVPELIAVSFTCHYKDGTSKTGVKEDWIRTGEDGWSFWSFVDLESEWCEISFVGFSANWIPPRADKNQTNNAPVSVKTLIGDINQDGIVDILDIAKAAKAYGSYPGHPKWDPSANMNGDKLIDILDIATIAKQYGMTCEYP